jgi:hypothetical protein
LTKKANIGSVVPKSEIHLVLKVSRQRADELISDERLPEPWATSFAGAPIWRTADLERWNAKRLGQKAGAK